MHPNRQTSSTRAAFTLRFTLSVRYTLTACMQVHRELPYNKRQYSCIEHHSWLSILPQVPATLHTHTHSEWGDRVVTSAVRRVRLFSLSLPTQHKLSATEVGVIQILTVEIFKHQHD